VTGPGPYDAVVLAGGRATRLGGAAKAALVVGGVPIAARVLAAVPDAARTVLVGDAVPGVAVDVVTRESPPGGGPVAGIAAGLARVSAPVVAVLGGDLPFLTAATVRRLRAALGDAPAALLVDDAGRDQYLCSVWRVAALRSALASAGGPAGVPLRAVVAAAGAVVRVPADGAGPPAWFDCDTPQDLATARDWAEGTR
jgi:molybdenum cofactor guanylyltransferase